MHSISSLEDALSRRAWEDVNDIFDAHFLRILLLDPALLDTALDALPPEWFACHPRHEMSRAFAQSARDPDGLVRQAAQQRFVAWVDSQEKPELRDLLGVETARIRDMIAHGWYEQASSIADTVLELIRTAHTVSSEYGDILPATYVRCGQAKLLAGDTEASTACFAEALRWARTGGGHPYARYAREHLALAHALDERYSDAAALIDGPFVRSPPDTVTRRLETPGLLARALLALSALEIDEAERLLDLVDDEIRAGDFGWAALHAQATAAILTGTPWDAIHSINSEIVASAERHGPGSLSGATLRADLASLYQAVRDLRAAERVMLTPGLLRRHSGVVTALARQALLRGRPDQALGVMLHGESARREHIPTRHLPSGAVVFASAELAASGALSDNTLRLAAASITHHRAFSALAQATPELRAALLPMAGPVPDTIPQPWEYRPRIKLTRREREMLDALETHATLSEVASALHVSINTAKTHVRALYRKLGAHSRDEALWLGKE